jgi:hypothetical protein
MKRIIFCILALVMLMACVPATLPSCLVSGSPNWKEYLCDTRWQPALIKYPPPDVSYQQNTVTDYPYATHTKWLLGESSVWPGIAFKLMTVGEQVVFEGYKEVGGLRYAQGKIMEVRQIDTFTLPYPNDPYSDWIRDRDGHRFNTYELLVEYDVDSNYMILQTCKIVNSKNVGRILVILDAVFDINHQG